MGMHLVGVALVCSSFCAHFMFVYTLRDIFDGFLQRVLVDRAQKG